MSNLITNECLSIDKIFLNKYLEDGFINKRILDFEEYKLKESKRSTVYDVRLSKIIKAKELFLEFKNGDYNSLADFAYLKFNKRDITSFRYLWIKYIDDFDGFLKETKSKNIGITSKVIKEKFG